MPGSFLFSSDVFAATTIFAPSRAARSAMALPMPRLAPVIKSVLPFKLIFLSSRAKRHIPLLTSPLSKPAVEVRQPLGPNLLQSPKGQHFPPCPQTRLLQLLGRLIRRVVLNGAQ